MSKDVVELTLTFEPPVTASDIREQCEAVVGRMEDVERDQEVVER